MDARAGKIIGLMAAGHYGAGDYTYCGSGSFCEQTSFAIVAITRLIENFFN